MGILVVGWNIFIFTLVGKYLKLVLHLIKHSNDPYSDLSDKVSCPAVRPRPVPVTLTLCHVAAATGFNDFTVLLQGGGRGRGVKTKVLHFLIQSDLSQA